MVIPSFQRLGRQMKFLLCVFCLAGLAACGTPTSSGYFMSTGLSDDKTALVVAGTDAARVTAILGEPHQRVRFDNLKATAWDYRYVDSWGYTIDFSVMIGDNGKVINKVSARAYADNN
jgi:outer membrane protein assembly factor BamE (lipoprotein component of BamABCDE complex)